MDANVREWHVRFVSEKEKPRGVIRCLLRCFRRKNLKHGTYQRGEYMTGQSELKFKVDVTAAAVTGFGGAPALL